MIIVFIFIGLFLILIGLMTWKLKITWIINGNLSKEIYNKEGLSAWVGYNLILMGVLVLFLEALGFIFPGINKNIIMILYIVIMIGMAIVVKMGAYRYEKKMNIKDKK